MLFNAEAPREPGLNKLSDPERNQGLTSATAPMPRNAPQDQRISAVDTRGGETLSRLSGVQIHAGLITHETLAVPDR